MSSEGQFEMPPWLISLAGTGLAQAQPEEKLGILFARSLLREATSMPPEAQRELYMESVGSESDVERAKANLIEKARASAERLVEGLCGGVPPKGIRRSFGLPELPEEPSVNTASAP